MQKCKKRVVTFNPSRIPFAFTELAIRVKFRRVVTLQVFVGVGCLWRDEYRGAFGYVLINQCGILRRDAYGDGHRGIKSEHFIADCVEVGQAVDITGGN